MWWEECNHLTSGIPENLPISNTSCPKLGDSKEIITFTFLSLGSIWLIRGRSKNMLEYLFIGSWCWLEEDMRDWGVWGLIRKKIQQWHTPALLGAAGGCPSQQESAQRPWHTGAVIQKGRRKRGEGGGREATMPGWCVGEEPPGKRSPRAYPAGGLIYYLQMWARVCGGSRQERAKNLLAWVLFKTTGCIRIWIWHQPALSGVVSVLIEEINNTQRPHLAHLYSRGSRENTGKKMFSYWFPLSKSWYSIMS